LHSFVKPTRITLSAAKNITQLITNVIVGDMRPVNLVEGHNFRKLIEAIAPGYNLPGRSTFTRKIEVDFLECKTKMKSIFKNAKNIALTTDMWSSVKMASFVGVTAHFLDTSNFKLKLYMLATKEVAESHTGENLGAWIEAILAEYEISPFQVTAIVTDNGANIVKACGLLKEKFPHWSHISCAAHTLQLCVKEALQLQQVKQAVGK